MSISAVNHDPRIDDVIISGERLEVTLRDGRRVSAPLAWFPRLQTASPADREIWEVCAGGYGIHWPKIDEDLSVEGLLMSRPALG